MTLMEESKARFEAEASDEEKAALAAVRDAPEEALEALHAVVITGAQMREAIAAIRHIQMRCEADAVQHGLLLAAYAEQIGLAPPEWAAPALHARAIAMDRWCSQHDPYGQTDVDAFFEAAARAPLLQTEEGMAFDPTAFRELIEFIAEMPF